MARVCAAARPGELTCLKPWRNKIPRLPAQKAVGDILASAPQIASCLYRVAQEALNNVLRHAHASTVEVWPGRLPDGRIVLRVADNGVGMRNEDEGKPRAFGLLGMRERLRAVGGTLRIESTPGAGTALEASVPQEGA